MTPRAIFASLIVTARRASELFGIDGAPDRRDVDSIMLDLENAARITQPIVAAYDKTTVLSPDDAAQVSLAMAKQVDREPKPGEARSNFKDRTKRGKVKR